MQPMKPAASGSGGKGAALLLEHCSALERLTGSPRPPAPDRLAAEIGGDFAWRLVHALSREEPTRGRAGAVLRRFAGSERLFGLSSA